MTNSVADTIRRNIDANLLPLTTPRQTWAGPGNGRCCDGCEQPITSVQMEYELTYGVTIHTYRLHSACFGIWLSELQRRGSDQKGVA